MALRDRLLVLYDEILVKLEADSTLRSFVRPRKPFNKLRTESPYVPTYQRRGGGYKDGSWVGFADVAKYLDPRTGIQFQFGISKETIWYGIWIQGDQQTRPVERDLYSRLIESDPKQIAFSINDLGNQFWFEATINAEKKPFIDTATNEFTVNHVNQLLTNLQKKQIWIWLSKNLSENELSKITDVPSDAVRTVHTLLGIYQWWTGIKPREMTEDEAYKTLERGEKLPIDDGDGNVPTNERRSTVNLRVGQAAVRKYALEIYSHECALCDVKIDELLRASHILLWSEDTENRGNPKNVICLCALHDLLFERDLLRISPAYAVDFTSRATESGQSSAMLRLIMDNTRSTIRLPIKSSPDPELLTKRLSSLS